MPGRGNSESGNCAIWSWERRWKPTWIWSRQVCRLLNQVLYHPLLVCPSLCSSHCPCFTPGNVVTLFVCVSPCLHTRYYCHPICQCVLVVHQIVLSVCLLVCPSGFTTGFVVIVFVYVSLGFIPGSVVILFVSVSSWLDTRCYFHPVC